MARRIFAVVVFVGATLAACATTPRTQAKRSELEDKATVAQNLMLQKDPGLRSLIAQSAGYIICPEVKEGGFIVGGAGAQCVVYERGVRRGIASLERASVGAQIGGQKYAELIVVRDKFTLDQILAGSGDLGAQASAVILRAGAASSTNFDQKGVAVFMDPIGGAMVNASISGQRIRMTM